MKFQPTLKTTRLRLRPFVATDAEALCDIAGSREIADSTAGVPHPYSLVAAKAWIAGLPHFYKADGAVNFAVELQDSGDLIGAIALSGIDGTNRCAELGFWIGVPWWGNGYATEATWELLHFGFSEFSLNRVEARHLVRSSAPQKVLGKLGMSSEGVLRQRIRLWDAFEDVRVHSLLRADVEAAAAASE